MGFGMVLFQKTWVVIVNALRQVSPYAGFPPVEPRVHRYIRHAVLQGPVRAHCQIFYGVYEPHTHLVRTSYERSRWWAKMVVVAFLVQHVLRLRFDIIATDQLLVPAGISALRAYTVIGLGGKGECKKGCPVTAVLRTSLLALIRTNFVCN